MKSFICGHCQKPVFIHRQMGTTHRNHCNHCLWSKHVDEKLSGDRKSSCNFLMQPIGLTFKIERKDKYGGKKLGDIMIIHRCVDQNCARISINRIATDDDEKEILEIYNFSNRLPTEILRELKKTKISLIRESERQKLEEGLFGKNFDTIS